MTVRRNRKLRLIGNIKGPDWDSCVDVAAMSARHHFKEQTRTIVDEMIDADEYRPHDSCDCSKPDCTGCVWWGETEWFEDWKLEHGLADPLDDVVE